jgi:GH25 family lysozyme M1 (1,4-beta-N-acetylmuramidase)
MEYGIDVSSYQGDVNWARVASDGITFAHGKATEGVSYRDPTFARNRQGARAYGIHFGAYHFARPDHNQPKQEAFFFHATIGRPNPGDVRPVLDLEKGDGNLTVWAGTFLAELERFQRVRPMLYSGPWFISAHLQLRALAGYPLWSAEYGRNDGQDHGSSLPAAEHQYTSNAVVRGVINHVDKNAAPKLGPLLVPAPPNPTPEPVKNPRLWPVPVPAWFWQWAQWRLDGQSYQRPWDAPAVVPPWAWARLRALGK